MTQSVLDRTPPPADLRVANGDDPLQFAEVRFPRGKGPHPCVIAIHGGFWRNAYSLDHLGHLCAALTGEGFVSWSIEYRRVGDGGGGWPGTFQDVTAAARYVFDHASEHGIDPERIVVLGHSAGGQLASWLASMANVSPESPIRAEPLDLRGAVALAGVLDLRQAWVQHLSNGAVAELLGGNPDGVPERYDAASPLALIPASVPQVVVHGAEDELVPARMSEAYQAEAALKGANAALLMLPGAGHFDLIDPESGVWPEIVAAVNSLVT